MRRSLIAVPLLALAAGTAACSGTSTPAANAAATSAAPSASSSPSPSPSAASSAPQATATAPLSSSQCSGADNGLKLGYGAWATLMRSGTEFTAWESATANYLSSARDAAQFDATFSGADAQAALDAQALASALAQLDADLQQGVDTGHAPASYPDDAKAATAAAALFDSCGS